MPRVDLDTYTPPAPALIEHGNSSSVAMRATASPSHKPNRQQSLRRTRVLVVCQVSVGDCIEGDSAAADLVKDLFRRGGPCERLGVCVCGR